MNIPDLETECARDLIEELFYYKEYDLFGEDYKILENIIKIHFNRHAIKIMKDLAKKYNEKKKENLTGKNGDGI